MGVQVDRRLHGTPVYPVSFALDFTEEVRICAPWFCVALMPTLVQVDIYRWTDARSKVRFSATSPAGAQCIEAGSQVVECDAAIRQREQRTQEYFDARRKGRTAAAERAGQRRAALAEECGCLRQQLSQLEHGGRFYRQDAGDGSVCLNDAELNAIRREPALWESECCRRVCSPSAGIVILDCKPQRNAVTDLQRHTQRYQLPSYLKVFNHITDEPMDYIGNISEDGLLLVSQLSMLVGTRLELCSGVSGLGGRSRCIDFSVDYRWTCEDVTSGHLDSDFHLLMPSAEFLELVEALRHYPSSPRQPQSIWSVKAYQRASSPGNG